MPAGQTFKALTGFRRALVPNTLQVWGKKGNRSWEWIDKREREEKKKSLFMPALLYLPNYGVSNHFSAVLPLFCPKYMCLWKKEQQLQKRPY